MSSATRPSLRRDLDAPEPFHAVKFDWIEPSTFESPFAVDSKINHVHIQCFGYDCSLIDLAVSKGVRRYLLLSGSRIEKGDAVQGKVHEYLDRCGAYSIAPNLVHLRVLSDEFKWHTIAKCYFTENFGSSFYHTICSVKEILSVVEDG